MSEERIFKNIMSMNEFQREVLLEVISELQKTHTRHENADSKDYARGVATWLHISYAL